MLVSGKATHHFGVTVSDGRSRGVGGGSITFKSGVAMGRNKYYLLHEGRHSMAALVLVCTMVVCGLCATQCAVNKPARQWRCQETLQSL